MGLRIRQYVRRVEYVGSELTRAREALKVSQADFAGACGWTQQHQCHLEKPGTHEISLESYDKINSAIAYFTTA